MLIEFLVDCCIKWPRTCYFATELEIPTGERKCHREGSSLSSQPEGLGCLQNRRSKTRCTMAMHVMLKILFNFLARAYGRSFCPFEADYGFWKLIPTANLVERII
jgi:hypothetical protein